MDTISHLPRTVFSENDLDVVAWALKTSGVASVPSTHAVKSTSNSLDKLCGVETKKYEGPLGHTYHVVSLASLIQMVCP